MIQESGDDLVEVVAQGLWAETEPHYGLAVFHVRHPVIGKRRDQELRQLMVAQLGVGHRHPTRRCT
jgi:hypothetical protein